MKTIFVDGYNVVNSWPNLNYRKNFSFEAARQMLIDLLHNYAVYKSCKIILVFDAHKVPGSIEKKEEMNKNVSIVFTKDGETADSYIEKHVNLAGRRCDITVVSSDNLVQQTTFQRGAVRMSSIEFYNEITSMEKSIRKNTEKNTLNKKNPIMDNIPNNILEKLEKIRRS
ncbi:NYN domain-containing protein [Clostridium sp. BJN0001]|uniref:NYN domain-containing protein n=1 Tax=Clostridium sp. BJN0001 TaxID=2930219 RepID=UPI001FD0A903|nr:NYN domain-containing protein [Clostridium sp. BJN0001]